MADMRVIQRGEDFGFALKTRQSIGISGQRRREDLESDLTLQLRVRRPVDLPHATRAERRDDVIGTEALAVGHGHESRLILVEEPPAA